MGHRGHLMVPQGSFCCELAARDCSTTSSMRARRWHAREVSLCCLRCFAQHLYELGTQTSSVLPVLQMEKLRQKADMTCRVRSRFRAFSLNSGHSSPIARQKALRTSCLAPMCSERLEPCSSGLSRCPLELTGVFAGVGGSKQVLGSKDQFELPPSNISLSSLPFTEVSQNVTGARW